MIDIKEKQLAFLNETCEHYNSNNRSQNSLGCKYYPAHDDTQGCAIGRHIADKDLCKKLDIMLGNSIGNNETFNLLPKELQEFGQSFLRNIQELHDTKHYWSETGLNSAGETKKINIIQIFNL